MVVEAMMLYQSQSDRDEDLVDVELGRESPLTPSFARVVTEVQPCRTSGLTGEET
jgi:hypothetical protein